MAETWDESKPAGSRAPSLGDDDIREFKRAVRERLAEDHNFSATENPAYGASSSKIGLHNFVTLVQRNTSKVTESDEVSFVCKEVSGYPELFLTPPLAGTDRQLTKSSGANINLNSGDFANRIIPTGALDTSSVDLAAMGNYSVDSNQLVTGAVTSGKAADYAIALANLNTGSVNNDKIVDTTILAAKFGSLETAGDTNYFGPESTLGGSTVTSSETSYATRLAVNFVAPGTFRFYWGYRVTNALYTAYFRIKKNGAVIVGPLTEGGANWTYRTDNLTVASGDQLTWESYVTNGSGSAAFKIWMRGTSKTGLFTYG